MGSRTPNWGTAGRPHSVSAFLGRDPASSLAAQARPRWIWIGPHAARRGEPSPVRGRSRRERRRWIFRGCPRAEPTSNGADARRRPITSWPRSRFPGSAPGPARVPRQGSSSPFCQASRVARRGFWDANPERPSAPSCVSSPPAKRPGNAAERRERRSARARKAVWRRLGLTALCQSSDETLSTEPPRRRPLKAEAAGCSR